VTSVASYKRVWAVPPFLTQVSAGRWLREPPVARRSPWKALQMGSRSWVPQLLNPGSPTEPVFDSFGPSLNPQDKRLAVHVEDHPLDYGSFEGIIPQGQYGGGTVMLWDTGTWTPAGDAQRDYARGNLTFTLHGRRLKGRWHLVRLRGSTGKRDNWLLIKGKDQYADAHGDVALEKYQKSVVSRRTLEKSNPLVLRIISSSPPSSSARRRAHSAPGPAPSSDARAISARSLSHSRRRGLPAALPSDTWRCLPGDPSPCS